MSAASIAPAFRAGVALAAPLRATSTHPGSRAGRLAVRCISATLRACGVDVTG